MAKITQEEFILKAIEKYSNYDYSKVKYINDRCKIIIGCPIHGYVSVRVAQFLMHGCSACNPSAPETIQKFIDKANKKHNYMYDYSKVTTLKSYTDEFGKTIDIKSEIICKSCNNLFLQSTRNHLKGAGCPECARTKRSLSIKKAAAEKTVHIKIKDLEGFIAKSIEVYGDKFDFTESLYTQASKNINLRCKLHPETLITRKPSDHISSGKAGYLGCRHCSDERIRSIQTMNVNDFVEHCTKIHNSKYTYPGITQFENLDVEIDIVCNVHGEFKQSAILHKAGHGCTACARSMGLTEREWLDSLNIPNMKYQHKIDMGKHSLYADGYDPDTNTIYEFHGDYWHGNPKVFNANDINEVNKFTFGKLYEITCKRTDKLKKLGYNVVEMWENDWKQILKERKNNDK